VLFNEHNDVLSVRSYPSPKTSTASARKIRHSY